MRDAVGVRAEVLLLTSVVFVVLSVGCGPALAATRAYVTNEDSGTVSVIDVATNMAIATIPIGSFPTGVAVRPDGTRAYITNQGSGTVSVIDTATNTVTATITVAAGPVGVAFSPDGTRAYVADFQWGNTVSVIDYASRRLQIRYVSGRVQAITTRSRADATAKGLSVGTSLQQLQDILADEQCATSPDDGLMRCVWYRGDSPSTFVLRGDVVVAIRIERPVTPGPTTPVPAPGRTGTADRTDTAAGTDTSPPGDRAGRAGHRRELTTAERSHHGDVA